MGTNAKLLAAVSAVCLILMGSVSTTVWAGSSKNNGRRSVAHNRESKPEVKPEALERIIARYENLLSKCTGKKSERCADIMFDLAKLQYDAQRDRYIKKLNEFEKLIKKWERNPKGEKPVHPVPDYSQPLETFRQFASEYPDYHLIDQVYYQIGNLLMLGGEMDESKKAFQKIIEIKPKSRIVSAAHFRLADFCYMDNDYTAALKHLNKIKREDVTIETWEMTHYRKGECYLHCAAFDLAVEHFFGYIEKCDAGEYARQELREEALENMAAAFADMPDGAKEAAIFFSRHRHKPYEAHILYTIGMKNRNHGQFDEAIVSLQTALDKHPWYKDAPVARYMQVECLVAKKRYEDANNFRIHLTKNYQRGSRWYGKNRRDKVAIAVARDYVKKALGTICVYLHAEAQKKRQRSLYKKALGYYEEFLQKFPDDMWKTYEFHYNVAEIYDEFKQYKRAAESYWIAATEDLSTYPPMQKEEIDETLFDDPTEFEKEKKKHSEKTAFAFTQADAGNNAIAVLDKLRKQIMSIQHLSDRDAFHLPVTQEVLKKCVEYQERFPDHPNTPRVLYLAGTIRYTADAYEDALKDFSLIVTDYSKSKVAWDASKMVAKTFTVLGKYNWALTEYREILQKTDPNSKEYRDIIDLAAGVIYSKAEEERKICEYQKAAEIFKSIFNEFPKSKITDRAWFEAAVCCEQAGKMELAALTFEELPQKFGSSVLREKAFYRAAENYKKLWNWDAAASILAIGASVIVKPDFAIPSFSTAAQYYEKTADFEKAGKMYECIAQRYPKNSKAPLALYNAALMFEKGKLYKQAIAAYNVLVERYPKNEYAVEAAYARGICMEKAGELNEAAVALIDFAVKFKDDNRKIKALKTAGDIYYRMGNIENARDAFNSAVASYDQFGRGNEEDLAHVHYMLGEINRHDCDKIKLTGKSVKKIRGNLKIKTGKLEEALKHYSLAIKTGVQGWVLKSNYQIGNCFVSFAEDEKNQRIFAKNQRERMAAKLDILRKLEKYYSEAQGKFAWNIKKAHKQKVTGSYFDSSITMFIKMSKLQGQLYEEMARMFETAPIPDDLGKDERDTYINMVEDNVLKILDKALTKYEHGVKAARNLHIADNPEMEILLARIRHINPMSDCLLEGKTAWTLTPLPGDTNDLFLEGIQDSIHNSLQDSTPVKKR